MDNLWLVRGELMTQPPGNLPATSQEPPGKTSRPTNYCAFYLGKTINGTLFVPLIRPPGTSRQPPGPQIPLIRTTNSDILRHKLFDILLNACRRQQFLIHFPAATSKEPSRTIADSSWKNGGILPRTRGEPLGNLSTSLQIPDH